MTHPLKQVEKEMSSVSHPSVVVATPSYSLVSDKLRRLSAGSLQCSLFCGGQRCKYECEERWSDGDKAVKGLFSHWVTPSILAMARPSSHLFQKHEIIDQFKRYLCMCVSQCVHFHIKLWYPIQLWYWNSDQPPVAMGTLQVWARHEKQWIYL